MTTRTVNFASDFLWGAATASYQIEGGWNEDGKGENIWDRFSHTPGKIFEGQTGDVACNHYHRWREDVTLMKTLGLNAYRFSTSWSRILPEGRGQVNQAGLDFYDRLVEKLLDNGIQPFITLYHWDLPQVLEDAGGWPNRDTVEAFLEYAGVVADRLGDRVRNWITFNEPWVASVIGYEEGRHAPGRTSLPDAMQAAHHLLLAHGLAVPLLRERSAPEAEVGISLSLSLCNPATDSAEDKAAADRGTLFFNNWFLHPLFKGEYPPEMVPLLDMMGVKREPEDAAVIATPIDFLGVNYYIRHLITDGTEHPPLNVSFVENPNAKYTEMPWEVYPKGIRELLENVQRDYSPRKIYITENGAAFNDTVEDGAVHDADRVEYLRGYLAEVNQAIANGVPVKGYFVWSLMDNFEWAYGFSKRFGVIYVDFETQQRIIKDSGLFYQSAIAANGFEVNE